MTRKRRDIDDLLNAIIAEAEVALRRASFEPNIEHMHRLISVIELRMKRARDERAWSLMDEWVEEAKDA